MYNILLKWNLYWPYGPKYMFSSIASGHRRTNSLFLVLFDLLCFIGRTVVNQVCSAVQAKHFDGYLLLLMKNQFYHQHYLYTQHSNIDANFGFPVSTIFYLLILSNSARSLEWQKHLRFDDVRFPGEFLINSKLDIFKSHSVFEHLYGRIVLPLSHTN